MIDSANASGAGDFLDQLKASPEQVATMPQPEVFDLSERIKQLRKSQELTVSALSKACGVAKSTISKIESGRMSPTFDILERIANGLGHTLSSFFSDDTPRHPSGRRSITLKGQGRTSENAYFIHTLLEAELSNKKMFPVISTIKARSIDEFTKMISHDGEEFFYVISGTVRVFTEFYQPQDLSAGDSMYFDCKMKHATISTGEEDAVVLWVHST